MAGQRWTGSCVEHIPVVPQAPWSLLLTSALPSFCSLFSLGFTSGRLYGENGKSPPLPSITIRLRGVEWGASVHSHLPAVLTPAHTCVHAHLSVHTYTRTGEGGREEPGHPFQPGLPVISGGLPELSVAPIFSKPARDGSQVMFCGSCRSL